MKSICNKTGNGNMKSWYQRNLEPRYPANIKLWKRQSMEICKGHRNQEPIWNHLEQWKKGILELLLIFKA